MRASANQWSPGRNQDREPAETLRKRKKQSALPKGARTWTTVGILRAIMLSALIPFLLLQTAIYVLWFQTRIASESNLNIEVARAVASTFNSYISDIRRQMYTTGNAMRFHDDISSEQIQALLAFLKKQYPAVLRFSLLDSHGSIVSSSDRRATGLSVADRKYFRDMQDGRDWVISDLVAEPVTNKMVINVVARVDAISNGDMIVAVIDPLMLGELALPLERPEQGVFTLFDGKGTLGFFGGTGPTEHSSWPDMDPVLKESIQERKEATGTIRYPNSDQDYLVARVPVPGFQWIAGAGRPVDASVAPVYRTLTWIAILNGAILIISFAGYRRFSRLLIERLDQLREYARRIAGGDFSFRPGIRSPAEIAELSASFEEMAGQIQSRQESLQRAIADLTRSNQELEQFAYVASHDLQEPLRVITGFVQLIEKRYKGQLDQDADRYIDFITDAVLRQQELIRDILTFSRLGRQTIHPEDVDMNAVLKTAIQSLLHTIMETGARVTFDPLPVVHADRTQLVQLFQNLISNGIKFKGQDDPAIHISVSSQNGAWIFAVQDNGIGIESRYWEQIFTMFKRLHTRKDYPGTGIGLAICKKIIERHGGRIWLDSKPGEGSTFFFTLSAAGETR